MQLSTTMLSELPTLGHRVMLEFAGGERRCTTRTLFYRRAAVETTGDGEPDATSAIVTDISDSGVGLLSSVEIKVGHQFVLSLPRRASKESFRVKCAVVRCLSGGAAGKQFVIGATFEQLLDGFAGTIPTPSGKASN
jgi:hypothetical protein